MLTRERNEAYVVAVGFTQYRLQQSLQFDITLHFGTASE